MISTTIQDAWLRNIDVAEHEVYLYREGDTVLYVGHSTVPLERLRSHLTPSNSSAIGKRIRENFPDSLQWRMDLFNYAECENIVKEHLPDEYRTYSKGKRPSSSYWVTTAERALIKIYRPSCNTTNNPDKIRASNFYLNATQAAKELGVNEKTVRRWIDKGELEATHVTKNRYAIPPSEVARVAQDMKPYGNPLIDALEERVRGLEASDVENTLLAKIDALTARTIEMEARLNRIQGTLDNLTSAPSPTRDTPPQPKHTSKPSTTPADVPAGSIMMREFVRRHDIKRDWLQLRIDRGEIPAISIPYRKGKQFWFTREQVPVVIRYLKGHDIKYGRCDDPGCACRGG